MYTRERIDHIIDLAEKDFKTGEDINKELVKKLEEDSLFIKQLYKSEQLIEFQQGKRSHTWLQYEDKDFKYCANKIEGSQFIAGNGPRNIKELDNLFDNIVFSRHNVENIICLGNITKDLDFYDYYNRPGDIETEKYCISSKIIDKNNIIDDLKLPGYMICDLTIVNKSTREIRHLRVNNFMVPDNGAIDLSYLITAKKTRFLDILLNIHQTALTKPIFVHCKYGIGRTGFFIFLLTLFEKYDDVFNSSDDAIVAENIHKILKDLRKNRPALVTELIQFKVAIKGACYLHKYLCQLLYKENYDKLLTEQDSALETKDFSLKITAGKARFWPKISQKSDSTQVDAQQLLRPAK